mmetsp:Transcript_85594/g.266150  ORF Transcript_85594/g.266150 Transcript_85594/m.266150 type:complete len:238 (-) Transcript_85594:6-719(-)
MTTAVVVRRAGRIGRRRGSTTMKRRRRRRRNWRGMSTRMWRTTTAHGRAEAFRRRFIMSGLSGSRPPRPWSPRRDPQRSSPLTSSGGRTGVRASRTQLPWCSWPSRAGRSSSSSSTPWSVFPARCMASCSAGAACGSGSARATTCSSSGWRASASAPSRTCSRGARRCTSRTPTVCRGSARWPRWRSVSRCRRPRPSPCPTGRRRGSLRGRWSTPHWTRGSPCGSTGRSRPVGGSSE